MSRRPIMAGNWKMNNLMNDSASLTLGILNGIKDLNEAQMPEVIIAPTFTSLALVSRLLKDSSKVSLAAQNCHWEASGAYTGEVTVGMLKDLGCSYIIIGHSERRQYFSETDEMINKKAKAILAGGLLPIICCGETLEQREAGVTDQHIASQIRAALSGLTNEEIAKSVIAYEPIWAIGTGKTCDAVEANRVIGMIRNVVREISDSMTADSIRILYGGSVKPATIEEQMSMSDIDGALIGGASLKADSFNEIITNSMKVAV